MAHNDVHGAAERRRLFDPITMMLAAALGVTVAVAVLAFGQSVAWARPVLVVSVGVSSGVAAVIIRLRPPPDHAVAAGHDRDVGAP